MMEGIYLLLGSNLGDKRANISRTKMLINREIGKITKSSSIYKTEPWGKKDQNEFLNQAIIIKSKLEPEGLLKKLKALEARIGRKKTEKWGERKIDIDILYYGKKIIKTDDLNIPHSEIPMRRFTLVPLAEIAPSFKHPEISKTNKQLLEQCSDHSRVVQLK